jgi:AcrR family transcriptional regulator
MRGWSVAISDGTRAVILQAAREALHDSGYAGLSTRRIAEAAGVPLSQIHYHFGSKQGLVLALLEDENQRRLSRQQAMYREDMPLWKQWEQACDYLEDDLASGYVRVLQEMIAAGWSNPEIGQAVRDMLGQWFALLAGVVDRARERLGGLGPFTADEVGVLVGAPFLGVESMILLGFTEAQIPSRSALRKFGEVIRTLEESR